MMLSPEIQKTPVRLVKKDLVKAYLAELFGYTRQIVPRWCRMAFHRGREEFKDKPRNPKKGKIIVKVVVSILALRSAFEWEATRIQQALYSA